VRYGRNRIKPQASLNSNVADLFDFFIFFKKSKKNQPQPLFKLQACLISMPVRNRRRSNLASVRNAQYFQRGHSDAAAAAS
jgi:hypothetical protein